MHKLYATSALFALAVGATVWAQPPAKTDPPGKKADAPKKPADPTDAALATALANDAGVKVARAKLQLAEAELAQAKQAVALRVFTLKAQLESLKAERDAALKHVEIVEAQVRAARANQVALAEARVAYEKANRALAVAEAEWKILTGGDGTALRDDERARFLYGLQMQSARDAAEKVTRAFDLPDLVQAERDHEARIRLLAQLLAQARAAKSPVGPVSDRIRAALDKPVQIGPKDQAVSVAKALEVFKRDAGLDVSIRGLELTGAAVMSQGETLPVGAWFQLYQDQFGMTAYVRDYGILFSEKKNAPADAVPLLDFWKQKPAPAAPEPKK